MDLKKREEIVKALECCYALSSDCSSCPFVKDNKSCVCLSLMAFALIKELIQEIKDLEAEYDRAYEQAEADIRGNMADGGTSCHWCADKTKADTVKRMQKLFEERLDITVCGYSTEEVIGDVLETLDMVTEEILKER